MTEILSHIDKFSSILLKSLFGWAMYKGVVYFANDQKQEDGALMNDKWNKDRCILIGHDSTGQSALQSLVKNDEHHINEQTFNRVQRRFDQIKQKYGEDATVTIHLRTPGGELFFAMLIANLVYQWKGKVVAHIHSYSASGGTLIALACDSVVMDKESVLGPIDPQSPKASSYQSLTNYLRAHEIDPNDALLMNEDSSELAKHKYYLVKKTFSSQKSSTDTTTKAELLESKSSTNSTEETNHDAVNAINAASARMVMIEALDLLRTYKTFLIRILRKNYREEETNKIIENFWVGRAHSDPIWRDDCVNMGIRVRFAEGDIENEESKVEKENVNVESQDKDDASVVESQDKDDASVVESKEQ